MYQELIKPALADTKNFILDILFPISCLVCEREGKFICDDCGALLARVEFQRCIVCQKPAPFGLTHPRCLTPYCADGLVSFYDYHDENAAKIIINGKYRFIPGAFTALASMIVPVLQKNYQHILLSPTPLALSPIPLHPSRKRWRGFNQADVMCAELSKQLNLPVADVLKRSKSTKTQKELKKSARIQNVSGAFTINPQYAIRNSSFILIDDVTTTGSTLLEAAKVLKRNGAKKVFCLTVARD